MGCMGGELSATSKASSENEKRTCPRSGHVYGELDATNEMSAEKEKRTSMRWTRLYSTPHQDVKELTRYLGDLNWMGHGSAYDGNEGRPRKRVSVLGTLRTMGRPFTGSQFHARNEEHKVPSSFRRTEHAQRTNSPTVVRKQH